MNKKSNKFNSLFLFAVTLIVGSLLSLLGPQKHSRVSAVERRIEAILLKESNLLSGAVGRDFIPYLVTVAKDYEVDPLLVLAVMKVESTFRPEVVSSRGAIGLLQIKPVAAKEVANVFGTKALSKSDLFNPYHNVQVGVGYLSHLKKMFRRDRTRMLSAFNMGPTLVRKNGIHSSKYSSKVLRAYQQFLSHDPEMLLAKK